jgi:hypothetical protein
MRSFRTAAMVAVAIALASACEPGAGVAHPTSGASAVIRPTESPTGSTTAVPPPPRPASPPPRRGEAASACVNGWVTPRRDAPKFSSPLGIIRRSTGVAGPLVVTDMRYFTGPESPPSDKGYLLVVERWYVRLWAKRDPAFQGRFLVEARRFGQGVSAVARYESEGFRSPDWIGFQYDTADTDLRAYPGLPGTWEGLPYDFVKGGEGLTIPGLPSEVAGCLRGT